MKQLLITIAAVVLVGCGESQQPAAEPVISIHGAITSGNIPDVKKLLAAGVDVNAKCLLGVTPLFYATFNENKAITKLLITAGADVNAKNVDGRIPLQNAAFNGHKEIAELLIAKGANVNAKDDIYGTPLDVAIEENHTEIADLLRKHGGKTAEELEAEVPAKPPSPVESQSTETVTEAANPEPPTAKALDILIRKAVYKGDIEAVKKHLASGADVKIKSTQRTSLHTASLLNRIEIAQLLITAGYEVNAKGADGSTPLDIAIIRFRKPMADLLRKHGGKYGSLYTAVRAEDLEGVNELLTEGANPNDKYRRRTPLDWSRSKKISDLLRKHGGKTGEELEAEGK